MLVVSDTSAVTSLLKIGRAGILADLFRKIVIPPAVREELLKYHAVLPQFLEVKATRDQSQVLHLLEQLDQGEAEAIVLSLELGADALLIDERRGRAIARKKGIVCLGLAGALLLAKRNGIIASLREILDELEVGARFYLAAELKRRLLLSAGE